MHSAQASAVLSALEIGDEMMHFVLSLGGRIELDRERNRPALAPDLARDGRLDAERLALGRMGDGQLNSSAHGHRIPRDRNQYTAETDVARVAGKRDTRRLDSDRHLGGHARRLPAPGIGRLGPRHSRGLDERFQGGSERGLRASKLDRHARHRAGLRHLGRNDVNDLSVESNRCGFTREREFHRHELAHRRGLFRRDEHAAIHEIRAVFSLEFFRALKFQLEDPRRGTHGGSSL